MDMVVGAGVAVLAGVFAAAAIIDARTRRLPNGLAATLAVCAALVALARGGAQTLGLHALAACATMALLVAFELVWRHVQGSFGQGMGDIKALGAAMLADPAVALAAYAAAMVMLAMTGAATRSRALPFLPFFATVLSIALVGDYLVRTL